jgi:L-lactate dehydrogenase complex protein LldE
MLAGGQPERRDDGARDSRRRRAAGGVPALTISLFITCYNDALFPETGKAVVAVLERLGHRVEFRAAQTCCGQMHYNTGYHADAEGLMRRFVDVFRDADLVCVPSSSCVAMIREHYPRLAATCRDAALEAAVASVIGRVHEFSELLVDRLGIVDVGAAFPHTVTYHSSCHALRALGVREQPLRLLRAVRGLELRALAREDDCCGFGGTFSVKNPDVSTAMLADKLEAIAGSGAAVCAAADNSCLLQIGGGLRRGGSSMRCLHLAEILAATGPAR